MSKKGRIYAMHDTVRALEPHNVMSLLTTDSVRPFDDLLAHRAMAVARSIAGSVPLADVVRVVQPGSSELLRGDKKRFKEARKDLQIVRSIVGTMTTHGSKDVLDRIVKLSGKVKDTGITGSHHKQLYQVVRPLLLTGEDTFIPLIAGVQRSTQDGRGAAYAQRIASITTIAGHNAPKIRTNTVHGHRKHVRDLAHVQSALIASYDCMEPQDHPAWPGFVALRLLEQRLGYEAGWALSVGKKRFVLSDQSQKLAQDIARRTGLSTGEVSGV